MPERLAEGLKIQAFFAEFYRSEEDEAYALKKRS